MSQQNPSPKRKADRQRIKRKISRVFVDAMSDIDNSSGVPLEMRVLNYDHNGSRKVKMTVLYEYEATDEEAEL